MGFSIGDQSALILLTLNLLTLIFLVFVLFQVLKESKRGLDEIKKGAKDLIVAGETLNSMYSLAERLATQLQVATFRNFKAGNFEGESGQYSDENTQHSNAPNFEENRSAVTRDGVDADIEVINLKTQLQEAQAEIRSMRHAKSQALQAESTAEELKKKVASYQSMLIKSRAQAKSAEESVFDLRSQIDALTKNLTRSKLSTFDEVDKLKEENEYLAGELKAILEKFSSLADEFQRAEVEKKFIEAHFIAIDEQIYASNEGVRTFE
jgi:chromosome segregation ATPase